MVLSGLWPPHFKCKDKMKNKTIKYKTSVKRSLIRAIIPEVRVVFLAHRKAARENAKARL